MEYRVAGMIRFHLTSKLKLGKTLSFNSPSGAQVALNSASDDNLSVQIVLEADDRTAAEEMAEIELDRISNLLSYLHNIPIQQSKVVGITYEQLNAEGKQIISAEKMAVAGAAVSIVKQLEPKPAEELRHHLEKEYSVCFEDVISMWKEAISTESPTLKYILLYRLIEYMFKNDTKALTVSVIEKEPSVQILHDRQRGDITIYTYLRDNVHPKIRVFPHTEIKDALPKLQSLVKQFIEEKYGSKYTC